MFQGVKGSSRRFLKKVVWVFHGNLSVSVFQRRFMSFSGVFQGKKFQGCAKEDSRKFCFVALLLHDTHCSYPSTRRACYRLGKLLSIIYLFHSLSGIVTRDQCSRHYRHPPDTPCYPQVWYPDHRHQSRSHSWSSPPHHTQQSSQTSTPLSSQNTLLGYSSSLWGAETALNNSQHRWQTCNIKQ